jgi:ABC-2 type transport system permease protein
MHGVARPKEPAYRLPGRGWLWCFLGILRREALRFLMQRGRFLSALVRPLVWLFIFAAGFRSVLGVSIVPPYETYVLYEVYVTPGLAAMILLFAGMQSSLSMVYDREVGSMRILLTSPYPRWFLLGSKLVAGTLIAVLQVYAFLGVAWWWEVEPPPLGYLTVLPALVLAGLMLGAFGLLLSSAIRQLENFASVMNFVIFPMFFASSALYPLWRVKESSLVLYRLCWANPFTHAVELVRFALYTKVGVPSPADLAAYAAAPEGFLAALATEQPGFLSLVVVVLTTTVFFGAAIFAYDPSRGLIGRRGGPDAGPT